MRPSFGSAAILALALSFGVSHLVASRSAEAQQAADGGPAARISGVAFSELEVSRVFRLSPLPELPADPSNAVADLPAAAELGEALFFDRRLSADGQRSCATCHSPERHWTDGETTSDPGARFPKNAPSLWNTAYNRWFFWNGRADSAWAQAIEPIEQPGDLGSNRLRLLHLLHADGKLREQYTRVFGPLPEGLDDGRRFPADARPMAKQLDHPLHRAWASMAEEDRRAVEHVVSNVGKAIASFERWIIVRDTPFDRFVAALEQGDEAAAAEQLSPSAIRGLKLFVGRGQCVLCHSGPTLSDGEFHDLGIALGAGMRIDPGRHRGVFELLRSPFHRGGSYADAEQADAPVHFLEQRSHQLGQFKTPQLRNVAYTAPYMHDGRFATLTSVVQFYSTRDGAKPLGHPVTLLQPLDLGEQEIGDLVAFLESLSGVD